MYRSKRYSFSQLKLKLAGRRELFTKRLSLPVFGVAGINHGFKASKSATRIEPKQAIKLYEIT